MEGAFGLQLHSLDRMGNCCWKIQGNSESARYEKKGEKMRGEGRTHQQMAFSRSDDQYFIKTGVLTFLSTTHFYFILLGKLFAFPSFNLL